MNDNKCFLIILFLFDFPILATMNNLALVTKPVIDLISKPKLDKFPLNNDFLNNIPLSPVDKKDQFSCIRAHQLLFNEVVNIIKEENNFFLIEISQVFYQTEDNKKINTTYYVQKKF